jgi:tetratricopeptide (TPR) repeat protein
VKTIIISKLRLGLPGWILLISLLHVNAQEVIDTTGYHLASKLENIFYQNDYEGFKDLVDLDYVFSVILEEEPGNENLEVFNEQLKGQDITIGLWREITYQIANGAYYNYVSYSTEGDEVQVLYRLFSDAGINYHRYEFHKTNEGFKIKDIFIYLTGDYFTSALKNVYISLVFPMLSEDQVIDGMDINTLLLINDANKAYQEGRKADAREILMGVPDKYKNHKIMLISELKYLDDTKDSRYEEIIYELEKGSNSNPSIYLLSIDKYFLTGEYQKSLDMVDSLYSLTQDEMLNIHRGNIKITMGQVEEGISHFLQLKDNFPYLTESYDNLINTYYGLGRYQLGLEVLKEAQINLNIEMGQIDEIVRADYPVIAEMPAFNEWIGHAKGRNSKMKEAINNQLKGDWRFVQVQDVEGKIDLTAKLRNDILFSDDGSFTFYKDKTVLLQGNWNYDVNIDVLMTKHEVDSTSAEGESIIKNNMALRGLDGNWYYSSPLEVFLINGSRMIIADGENQYAVYEKAIKEEQRFFEGKVLYHSKMEDKTGELTATELETIFGKYNSYYSKGEKYRVESSGIFSYVQLYTGGDSLFQFTPGGDTLFYELLSEDQEDILDWEIIEEGSKVLGFQTKRFFYHTLTEKSEIYYSETIKVDMPEIKNEEQASWNIFKSMTSSLPLKSYFEDEEMVMTLEAVKIIYVPLDDELFKKPALVRSKLKK